MVSASMPVATRKESERGWLAVVSQIIRHWLRADRTRAHTEEARMRAAVMVFVCRISVAVTLAVPYRTPVPRDRVRAAWPGPLTASRLEALGPFLLCHVLVP